MPPTLPPWPQCLWCLGRSRLSTHGCHGPPLPLLPGTPEADTEALSYQNGAYVPLRCHFVAKLSNSQGLPVL